MDQLYNHHLPPPQPPAAPSIFTSAPSPPHLYQAPPNVFPTPSSMSLQQQVQQLGDFASAGAVFSSVHTDSTHTLYSNSSSTYLPPYSQMIKEAIGTLRERDGSSKQAIAKYIERAYTNLPANHLNLLTQHLKRMKDSGELVMVRNSYMVAASEPAGMVLDCMSQTENLSYSPEVEESADVIKYSQGAQQEEEAPVVQEPAIKGSDVVPGSAHEDLVSLYAAIGLIYDGSLDPPAPAPAPAVVVPVPKRQRGRPKKILGASNVVIPPAKVSGARNVVISLPKVSGASDAVTSSAPNDGVNEGLSVKRRAGRPPKKSASVNSRAVGGDGDGGSVIKPSGRGRGRPPKQNAGVYSGKPRGRPRRNVEVSALVKDGAEVANLNDGHDRPRRNVEVSALVKDGAEAVNVNDGHVGNEAVAVFVGRKRGRPAGSANKSRKSLRSLSAKPLGRPFKKTAPATAVVEVSNLQQLLACHLLKSKLEFFQSRIKHNVAILKPVVLNNIQNASIVSGAIHELEELATLDVNAPSA